VLAPAQTPAGIIAQLNREIGSIVGADDFRAMMAKQGVTVNPGTPGQFASFYAAEMTKWAKVVRQAKIPPVN
jgi:tripartite-type tricarboxylate transporter receptor subunit TctC